MTTTTIAAARRHIESLSDEEILQEFSRTWTDRAQVARAIRKVMLDALEGEDTAVLAIEAIARECGLPSAYSPAHVLSAVIELRKRKDSALAQLEATPVLSMADRSKLASMQLMEDRDRDYAKLVAERDELARQLAEIKARPPERKLVYPPPPTPGSVASCWTPLDPGAKPTADDVDQGLFELYGLGYRLVCNAALCGWRFTNVEHPYQETHVQGSPSYDKTIAAAIHRKLPSWNPSTWRSRRGGDGGPPRIGDG